MGLLKKIILFQLIIMLSGCAEYVREDIVVEKIEIIEENNKETKKTIKKPRSGLVRRRQAEANLFDRKSNA